MTPAVPAVNEVTAVHVLAWVNARHDFDLELIGLFAGGRQGGAWRARTSSGAEVVFKWTANRGLVRRRPQAAAAVAQLRELGYPTPAWLVAGVTDTGFAYVVQERVGGEPGVWATVPLPELVATVELQAGLGRSATESWSSFVEWAAHDDSGPRRDVAATAAGRALLEHFDAVLAEYVRCVLPTDDLVHGDMNTSNVLVADGRVSAVIDIDAIGEGTRAVDYAWLLREAFTVHAAGPDLELIRAAGTEVAGPAVFATCVTATAFDIAVFEARAGTQARTALRELHALADFVRRA